MSDRTVSVGLKIEGDAKGAKGAVGEVRQGLSDLKDDSDKVKLLEGGSLRAKELSGELERLQTETKELAEASARVKILESAIASVDQYKLRVTEANAEVRKIQATLSEAYSSGADNSLLSDLERRLRATENAAKQANSALETSKGTLVKLNLEAEKTGISTGNLAEKKLALDAATKKLTTDFDALKSGSASVRQSRSSRISSRSTARCSRWRRVPTSAAKSLTGPLRPARHGSSNSPAN